ncbi:hypothetical protein [Amycolatopsis aidingensis]|uniref:hypothetical protein n=1 Tax=Amycolatopsis aidingensis TaxID=2842453 RepID=UPI001C0CA6AD|nr:hypothetical protein [Amycolatopsis aidingensis]
METEDTNDKMEETFFADCQWELRAGAVAGQVLPDRHQRLLDLFAQPAAGGEVLRLRPSAVLTFVNGRVRDRHPRQAPLKAARRRARRTTATSA